MLESFKEKVKSLVPYWVWLFGIVVLLFLNGFGIILDTVSLANFIVENGEIVVKFSHSEYFKWLVFIFILSMPFVLILENRKREKRVCHIIESTADKISTATYEKMNRTNRMVEYILNIVQMEKMQNISNEIETFILKLEEQISKYESEKSEIGIDVECDDILFSYQKGFILALPDKIRTVGGFKKLIPNNVQPKFKFYVSKDIPDDVKFLPHRNERHGIDPDENRIQFKEWRGLIFDFRNFKVEFDSYVSQFRLNMSEDRKMYGF